MHGSPPIGGDARAAPKSTPMKISTTLNENSSCISVRWCISIGPDEIVFFQRYRNILIELKYTNVMDWNLD